jgi:predicted DNA-binding transcriptional regulator AlpA
MSVNDSVLLTDPELTAMLKIKVNTLADWRHRGKGPRYIKVGQLVRYRRSDVESWLEDNTRSQTIDAV